MSPDSREDSILRSLRRILRAASLHSRQLLRLHHITAPQLICLRHLRDLPEAPTAGDLAKGVSLSQATITGLVDRLEHRGLVERQRGVADRRRVRIQLTDEGRSVAWDAPSPLHELFARRLALLPDNAARQIDEVLQDVVQMMEAGDLDAAPLLAAEAALDEPTVAALAGSPGADSSANSTASPAGTTRRG